MSSVHLPSDIVFPFVIVGLHHELQHDQFEYAHLSRVRVTSFKQISAAGSGDYDGNACSIYGILSVCGQKTLKTEVR